MPLSRAFREFGSGPPLVILHGLFGSARNWQSMAERLAGQYRVFACDLRNHGDSPWAATMSFAEMADDLEAFIDEKGLAPATVLGHSVGGKTAMLTALRHPDVLDALIVVDIAPVAYEEPFLAYIAAMQTADVGAGIKRGDIDAALAAAVPDAATRLFLLQNLEERAAGGFAWRLNLDAIAANMPALLDFPATEDLAYDGRALFVSGAASDYIGRVHHGAVWDRFPQAEFAVIDGSGHYPHVEQPDAFFERITLFLDSAYA
ncbi:MAG: alpha/beta fold hydrolase [Rhodospirillales bacterium]|nr:alpha/beta fold hydrolase [Rhodospirillales bacterium]